MLTCFRDQIGLTPKTAARVIRFQHVLRQLCHPHPSLADIALQAGYSDQAHLSREFRSLAGTTLTELSATLPGGDRAPYRR